MNSSLGSKVSSVIWSFRFGGKVRCALSDSNELQETGLAYFQSARQPIIYPHLSNLVAAVWNSEGSPHASDPPKLCPLPPHGSNEGGTIVLASDSCFCCTPIPFPSIYLPLSLSFLSCLCFSLRFTQTRPICCLKQECLIL